MELIINLIPIVVILLVLILWKKHMMVAGLVASVVAILIGRINLHDGAALITGGINTMFSYTSPILYAAAAVMVSKGGGFQAIISLAKKVLKDKIGLFAGFLVLVQALATYMAGMGAGNTMVIAPLVAVAVGAIPEVIAGMALATAVCFTTSPASTETVLAAEAAGIDVGVHASNMLPFTLLFVVLGAALAVYGVHKRGVMTVGEKREAEGEAEVEVSSGKLWVQAVPALALLIMVIAGSKINRLFGINIFMPVTNVIITAILVAILSPLTINETCEALGDGSRYILTTLFSVGIFLGFINIIAELGTFEQLAALVGNAPSAVIVPCAVIMSFLIAIPSGAMCAGVLALILPTLSLLGMPSSAMGFVAIAAGIGTQVSPVQVNLAALSDGFKVEVMTIVKNNMKYMAIALGLLVICSFIFA